MALPSYYISTSVTCVNTTTTSKILMLPPANTIPNVNLYIYDSGGAAATNPIYVSTQQGDEIDNGKSTITMNANNQSFRITPYNASKYAICQNYTEGLTPFQYAIRILATYQQLNQYLTTYTYRSSAISDSGLRLLVTGTGFDSDKNGIYVATDGGTSNWSFTPVVGSTYQNDSSCMSSTGQIMWCSFDTGYIYNSRNGGVSFNEEFISPGGWKGISCTSGSTDDDLAVVFSVNNLLLYTRARGWEQLSPGFYISYYTGVAISGNGSKLYVGTNEYVLLGTKDVRGVWSFTQGGGPSAFGSDWSNIVCSEDGTIAYAKVLDASGFSFDPKLYKTTDSGVTWTELAHLAGYKPMSCDSTGNVVLFLDAFNTLFLSLDGGVTVTEVTPSLLLVYSAALSRNASFFVATDEQVYGGFPYKGTIRLA